MEFLILNAMQKETYQELKQFISDEIGVNIEKIYPASRLEDDLGITGDDGIDLINKYTKIFNVDISDFIHSKYFHSEPSIFNVLNMNINDLTVQRLFDAIVAGKLI